MRSISESFSAGITGATITVVGMPASESRLSASSRFAGVEARGELEVRLRLHSPRRHLAAALASPAFAISSPA